MTESAHPAIGAALAAAQRLAHDLGLELVGTEHLLLGALSQTDNQAVRLCGAHGLTEAQASAAYHRMFAEALARSRHSGRSDQSRDILLGFTPRASTLLQRLQGRFAQADALGRLLLELAEEGIASSIVRETLRTKGNPEQVRLELVQALHQLMAEKGDPSEHN